MDGDFKSRFDWSDQQREALAAIDEWCGGGNGSELPEQVFDFGYSITLHKAQGSEWPAVLVYDEGKVFRGLEREWRYTAITRAAKRVTVVVR